MLLFGQNAVRYFLTLLKQALDKKADAVPGKGLSTNDYTDTDMEKLGKITAAEAACLAGARSNLQAQIDQLAQGTPAQTAGSGVRVAAMADRVTAKMQIPTASPSPVADSFRAVAVNTVAFRAFSDAVSGEVTPKAP